MHKFATLVITISEGGTNILYAIKLVPPKDLGSIVHPDALHWHHYSLKCRHLALFIKSVGTWHYLLKVLAFGVIYSSKLMALVNSPTSMWHALIFLKSMVSEHVLMDLI